MAGAEQRARGDDPVAGFQVRQQRGIDRGHAGGGGAAGLGALDQAKPLFQHGQRRVGEAGVLVVVDRCRRRLPRPVRRRRRRSRRSETALPRFRHGGCAGRRHEPGGWRDAGGMDRVSFVRALARDGPTVEQLGAEETDLMLASLARLFHLAAIRPDKSRGPGTSRQSADKTKLGAASMGVAAATARVLAAFVSHGARWPDVRCDRHAARDAVAAAEPAERKNAATELHRPREPPKRVAWRGCSSMVERQLPKLHTRVRFPSPAPFNAFTDRFNAFTDRSRSRPDWVRGTGGVGTVSTQQTANPTSTARA